MIQFHCNQCGKKLRVPLEHAGKRARCKQCGNVLHVPLPTGEGASADSPPPAVATTAASPQVASEPEQGAQPVQVTSGASTHRSGRGPWIIAAAGVVAVGIGVVVWLNNQDVRDDNEAGAAQRNDQRIDRPGQDEPASGVALTDQQEDAPGSEDAERMVAQLRRLAAAAAGETRIKSLLADIVWRVYAAAGMRRAALDALPSDEAQYRRVLVLLEVQEGQLRRGQASAARDTADEIQRLLDQAPTDKPRRESAVFPYAAAVAWARLGEHQRVQAALDSALLTDARQREQVAEAVMTAQARIGDLPGARQTAANLDARRRASALHEAVTIYIREHDAPPLSFYQALLDTAKQDGADGRNHALDRLGLIGLCRHKQFDQAAAFVIDLDPQHRYRAVWMSAISHLQARAGDLDGAIANTKRAGYLVPAAAFALDAGRPQGAAQGLRIVLLSLPELPAPPAGDPNVVYNRDDPIAAHRVRLLRQIAVLQFRAGQSAEAASTRQAARDLATKRQTHRIVHLLHLLDTAEAEAAIAQLHVNGDLGAAITTAKRLAAEEGAAAAVAELWVRIGVRQWEVGDLDDARDSFHQAIKTAETTVSGKRVYKYNPGDAAAARARAGDARGAFDTLMLAEEAGIAVQDERLTDIAVALTRAGDVDAALRSLKQVQMYRSRHAAVVLQIAMAHADVEGIDAAFGIYLDHARPEGVFPAAPTDLLLRAIERGRTDLAVKHLNSTSPHVVAKVAAACADAGKPDAARRIAERAFELRAARTRQQRQYGDDFAGLVDLMATYGDAKAVDGLLATANEQGLEPLALADLFARRGDVDRVISLAKSSSHPRGAAALIDRAMRVVAAPVIPLDPRRGDGEKPMLDDAERPRYDETELAFLEQEQEVRLYDADGQVSVLPPHVPPAAATRLASRAAEPLIHDEADVTADRWTVATLYAGVSGNAGAGPEENLAIAMNDGEPVVFAIVTGPKHGWSVMAATNTGGRWSTNTFADPRDLESYWAVDAVTINGRPWVALSSSKIDGERSGAIEVRTIVDGQWKVAHEARDGGAHSGQRAKIAMLNGRPVLVYTAAAPRSAGWSKNVELLELSKDGLWTASRLPVPYNAGVIHFALAAFGEEAVVAFTSAGGFGKLAGHRRDGQWRFENFSKSPEGRVYLCPIEGEPALLGVNFDAPAELWVRRGDQWRKLDGLPQDLNTSFADFRIVRGKPSIACWDRTQRAMRLLIRNTDGGWDNHVLATTDPLLSASQIRLFEWRGKTHIAAIASLRGQSSVVVLSAPAPSK